jgi:hypothetical protein
LVDGIVQLLVELGLVKKKGKQRLDSTHIVGYVKAMSWTECALETLRLGLEDLACDAGTKKRPEFWSRLWKIYVESNHGKTLRATPSIVNIYSIDMTQSLQLS